VSKVREELERMFPNRMYTPTAAAKILCCTRMHISNLITEGGLEAINLASKLGSTQSSYKIPRWALIDFLEHRAESETVKRALERGAGGVRDPKQPELF